MARKRMIDPTIWADEDFGQMTSEAQVVFIGMISNADDEGRLPGNALFLCSTILPYKALSEQKSKAILKEILENMRSVALYIVNDKEYIQLTKFLQYQVINKASESKYPPLPDDYRSPTVVLPPNRIEENRIEGSKNEKTILCYEELLSHYNTEQKTNYRVLPTKNVDVWLKVYSVEDIKTAISNIKNDSYWKDKMKPEILFRTKDTAGNEIDRIGSLLNDRVSANATSSIFDGVTKI